MTDQELSEAKERAKLLLQRCAAADKAHTDLCSEWCTINGAIEAEETKRKYYAQFNAEAAMAFERQKARNIGAALAGGATTLAECTGEAKL